MQKIVPTLCALLVLSACGFEAPPPKRTQPPPTPQPPLSTIAVTLTVPVNDIVTMLNQKTAQQIASMTGKKIGCFIAKCKMDMLATRTAPITGAAENNGISLTLPFSVTAHVSLNGGFFKSGGDANALGQARAFTTVALTPDWRVQTHTTGDVKLSDSKLKLGPIDMNVTDLWNHNDEHLSDAVFKELDKRIGPAIKLKPQAEKLWARVQQPIRVGKKPLAWLVLTPEALRIGQVRAQDNSLVVSLAADVRGHVVIADMPPAIDAPLPLPRPMPLGNASNRFAFIIPLTLSYEEAAQLALHQIQKKPPHVGSTEVKISKLEILPSGQDVVVSVRFCVSQSWDVFGWFDSCGDGYLRGTPVFDAAANTVRIANVHYDIGTENMLLAAMRWLAGDQLGQQLQQHLVFNVAHDMDKLEASVAKALAKPQSKGVTISGHVESFGKPMLSWTDKGFLALFTAEGTVDARLDLEKP